MKQIASFTKADEAEMLRSFLEGSGIEATIRDDYTVTADWGLSNAVGGVKVDVADEDAERALALLREFSPPPVPSADTLAKSARRPLRRYLKIWLGLFVLLAVGLTVLRGYRDGMLFIGGLLLALIISALLTLFAAMFDR